MDRFSFVPIFELAHHLFDVPCIEIFQIFLRDFMLFISLIHAFIIFLLSLVLVGVELVHHFLDESCHFSLCFVSLDICIGNLDSLKEICVDDKRIGSILALSGYSSSNLSIF